MSRTERLAGAEGWRDFRLGYQPSFDGLRGLGATALILFHGIIAYEGTFRSWFLPGAYLWLEIFFVQSGFLITSLLLDEHYRTGAIGFGNFYARRALRLLPALLVVVGLTAFWLLTFSAHKGNPDPWREVWGGLFYVQNWFLALDPNPYPFYLSHTWYLSIDQQFYLVAPMALAVLLRLGVPLRRITALLLVGAGVSAAWMALLARGTGSDLDLGRLYYASDTRAQGLLVGMALACAIHGSRWLNSERSARIARVAGWIGVPVMIGLLLAADIKNRLSYYGSFLVCDLAIVGILSEVVRHPGALLDRVLSWWPFRVTGERAYGLYLWHWPIMIVTPEFVDLPEFPMIALQVALAFVVATVSYRYLERPLQRRFSGRFPRVTPEREEAWSLQLPASDARAARIPRHASGGPDALPDL